MALPTRTAPYMSLARRKSREIVLQILYSYDLSQSDPADLEPLMMESHSITRANMRSAHQRAEAVRQRVEELDAHIAEVVESYAPERMQRVERNILRLALYELLFEQGIPPKVCLAEAVRLARKFCSPEAASFVNGVLDALYHRHVSEEESEEEDKHRLFFGDHDPVREE